MKQSLKYGLLLVLALLIHVVANETIEESGKVPSPVYRQERCCVSQNHPIHNALERLYNFYSTQSCDMSHADIPHVPADKSILYLITYIRGYRDLLCSSHSHYPHIPKHFYEPISYYIYGLRKIVI